MCGIAGFIGKKNFSEKQIKKTLKLMYNRGPDNQDFFYFRNKVGNNVYLLASRLSIVNQSKDSNQPLRIDNNIIIFNGEIYNILELRQKLKKLGVTIKTSSDTEIILRLYNLYGENCLKHMEGMWSFVIYNTKSNKIFMSRDRFGEKPFLYFTDGNDLYFGSEFKFIQSLHEKKINVNLKQVTNYLNLGYKSLYKFSEGFFERVKEFPKSSYAYYETGKKLNFKSYWNINYKEDKDLTEHRAIRLTKEKLIDSLEKRINTKVPVGLCLSGGIDSVVLAYIVKKIFNKKIQTYSIVDRDTRYSEKNQIDKVVKDLQLDNKQIVVKKSNSLDKLDDLISYKSSPISTVNYFNHSLMMDKMKKDGIKVSLLGTAADEIFGGYYDHYLLQIASLYQNQKKDLLKLQVEDFNKFTSKYIRNNELQNPYKYIKNPNSRNHIFDERIVINKFLYHPSKRRFFEKKYCSDILRNRMLNELNCETTPVILNEDDLNSMNVSIENRSPFLDSNLVKFANTIPTEFLIKNGYNKYILREAFKGIVHKDILKERRKIGFNSSINDVFNLENKNILNQIMDKKSPIFDLVDYSKMKKILKIKKYPNYLSKFVFNFINANLFLKKFY